ncbi:hypothetical protein OIU84_000783 [Salix udensis]|uniref:Phosphatidylinositol-specific phospholipase C X domain-containing protein n=1 Tax=Salix udensis TaxID=889485 RepID=A0AAD6L5J8_9ROSI|nr:hypothetical protein OIU84_000783 [Salix udensis]
MSLMKRRRMESGWEGFKIEESGKKREIFHANYSSEKAHQYLVRLEAKDRAFCVKFGTCKFGANSKFNHPIRRKNRTLTLPVDLLICMRAIKNNAFQASEYPVVITFDDRLPANLQAKVAESLKKNVMILTKPPNEYLETQQLYSGSSGKNGEIVVYRSYGEKERMISMFWKSLHDARPLISKEETAAVVVTAHSKNDEGMSSFAATKIATPPKKRDVLQPLQHRFIF